MRSQWLRVVVIWCVLLTAQGAVAAPVSPSLTYQGQLKVDGVPYDGLADVQFTLWADVSGGSDLGLTTQTVDVVNGLFTADVNFGAGLFDGQARYLQVAVRAPAGVGSFVPISPRQPITPAPYAIHALNAPVGHTLDAADGAPTDAVFVDAAGNVGIGTASPEGNLHVFHGSAGVISANSSAPLAVESNGNTYVNILAPDANESGVLFGRPGSSVPSAAGGIIFAADGLHFRTGGNQTRMIIDSVGDVGIGAINPSGRLHIVGAAAPPGSLVGADNGLLLGSNGTASYKWIQAYNGALALNPAGNNVGIGTSSPTHRLHVLGEARFRSNASTNLLLTGGGDDAFIDFIKEASITPSARIAFDGFTDPTTHRGFLEFFTRGIGDTGLVERMRITDAGDLGLGTTTPASRLHISGTGGVDGLLTQATDATYARLSLKTLNNEYFLQTEDQAGDWLGIFQSGGTAGWKMVIEKDSGDVGIGTTSPQQSLSVQAGMNIDQGNQNSGTTTATLRFGSSSGEAIGSKRTAGGNQFGLDFYTNSLNRLAITLQGNVGIGTTAPANRFVVTGAGAEEGGVPSVNEVVARFRQTTAGTHSAVSVDSLAGQDPILYLAENGEAKWGIRNDSGFDELEFRYHTGGANNTAVRVIKSQVTGFTMTVDGRIWPEIDDEYDLGNSSQRWQDVFASNPFIQTSDRRFKTDVADLHYGLKELLALRPVRYKWKKESDPRVYLGLISQEVEPIVPEAVVKDGSNPDAPWALTYTTFIPVLIKAVQEQQSIIEGQRETIESLQSRLERLENLVPGLAAPPNGGTK